ncbi:hypothetical protein DDT91_04290 [Algoriphagus sp. AK58]|nr:hypothetical protein [Algoriphagus sp. AK58]
MSDPSFPHLKVEAIQSLKYDPLNSNVALAHSPEYAENHLGFSPISMDIKSTSFIFQSREPTSGFKIQG